jgi:hypothetical protein
MNPLSPPPESVGPEFGRVSFSCTRVYRLPPDEFMSTAAAIRKKLGGSPEGAVKADFNAIRGSVIELMPTAVLERHELSLQLLPDGAGALASLFAKVSEASAFLSLAEGYSTISVTVNFFLPTASADELIALSHSFDGRCASSPVRIRLGSTTSSVSSLNEMHEHLAGELGISSPNQITDHFRCIEIREIESLVNAAAALRAHGTALYGVLLGDEGWRHVQEPVASAILANTWGTRSFFTVVGAGDGCLMLNLRPRTYSTSQGSFFTGFFGAELPYFSHEFKLANLEHGPFFAMELCSYRRCVVDDLRGRLERRGSAASPPSVLGGIMHRARRRSLYHEMTKELRRLQLNRMTELAALDNAIEAGSGLPDRIVRLTELVQAFEEEEQVAYMYRVNSTMAFLAWIGVVVATLGAVIAVIVA